MIRLRHLATTSASVEYNLNKQNNLPKLDFLFGWLWPSSIPLVLELDLDEYLDSLLFVAAYACTLVSGRNSLRYHDFSTLRDWFLKQIMSDSNELSHENVPPRATLHAQNKVLGKNVSKVITRMDTSGQGNSYTDTEDWNHCQSPWWLMHKIYISHNIVSIKIIL